MRSRNGLMCQTIAKKKASVPDCMALIGCSRHTKASEISTMSPFLLKTPCKQSYSLYTVHRSIWVHLCACVLMALHFYVCVCVHCMCWWWQDLFLICMGSGWGSVEDVLLSREELQRCTYITYDLMFCFALCVISVRILCRVKPKGSDLVQHPNRDKYYEYGLWPFKLLFFFIFEVLYGKIRSRAQGTA